MCKVLEITKGGVTRKLTQSCCKSFYTIDCPVCKVSDNSKIREANNQGLFTVKPSNIYRDTPCGCSSRLERIGVKLGIDFYADWKVNDNITLQERNLDKPSHRFYKCSICSEDYELFPDRFSYDSSRLRKGISNCGCSSSYKWSKRQYEILCRRKAQNKGYSFKGFVNTWEGYKTKCVLSCKLHGTWDTCSIDNLLRGRSCPSCAQEKRNSQMGNRNGYYHHRRYEEDYLYFIKISDYYKIGRAFSFYDRLRSIKSDCKSSNIKPLKLFSATHEDIWRIEQEILKQLRGNKFYSPVKWSSECFTEDGLEVVKSLLDNFCSLSEIEPVNWCEKVDKWLEGI